MVENFVEGRTIKIHYYRTGNGTIPVMLVHGLTDDGLCWTPIAEALSKRFDLYLIDLPGHGKSGDMSVEYSLENLVEEVASAIGNLQISQPIIIGHSLGAITTMLLAGMYPRIPRAILLEDPPAFWRPGFPTPEATESMNGLRQWIELAKRMTRKELLEEERKKNPQWPDYEFDTWADAKERFSPLIGGFLDPQRLGSVPYQNLFRQITCPTILFHSNTELGGLSFQEDIDCLRSWIGDFYPVYFAKAGHSIRRDQFSAYLDAVRQVLEKLN